MRKSVTGNFVVGSSQTDTIQLNENYTLAGVTISGSVISGSLISFLVSDDGTNFYSLYDSSSAEVTLTVTSASRCYAVNPNSFLQWNFVKAVLGTSGSVKLQATYAEPIIFELMTMK